jgi:uncharacterized SAM-binding protein YcdF (DUF218 family)
MTHDRRRRALRFLARASLGIGLALVVSFACALPFAGRYLVSEDPVAPADAIIVLGGTRAGRWLEALDLYEERMAPHIVLSSDRADATDFEFHRRGIRIPRTSDLVRDAMIQLGVRPDAVEVFPFPLDNTAHEAEASRRLAVERGWGRLLIVSSKYHTRRARFAFERALRGTGIQIIVRGTRYDQVSPRTWWTDRYDTRWVLQELLKLIAYRLGLEG